MEGDGKRTGRTTAAVSGAGPGLRIAVPISTGRKTGRKQAVSPDRRAYETGVEQVGSVKKQDGCVEEPDRVFSMVKHHFQDFLDSLEYTLRDKEEHPEADHLGVHWEIENTSRLNRHPDEERCQGLTDYLREICDAKDCVLELIRAKAEGSTGDLSEEFLKESRMVEMYRTDRKRFFSSFSDSQMERVEKALIETETVLKEMAEELRDDEAPAAERRKKT